MTKRKEKVDELANSDQTEAPEAGDETLELEPVVELEPEVQGKGKYYEDLFQGGK